MTEEAPKRKRWMEPGAAPYSPPRPARQQDPGSAVGFLVVAPIVFLFVTAMASGGADFNAGAVIGGAIITALIMFFAAPRTTRKR